MLKDGSLSEAEKYVERLFQNALPMVAKSTKLLQSLPCGASRDAFYAYPSFGKIIDVQSHDVLCIISRILKFQNVKGNIERRQQDEQFEMILDCNDVMLERINCNLDNLSGVRRQPKTIIIEAKLNDINQKINSGVWNTNSTQTTTKNKLITALNIPRPQANFNFPIDNSVDTPFRPKLKEKPNALIPLSILPEFDSNGDILGYSHPYETELLKFEPPIAQLEVTTPQKSADIFGTEFTYVEKKEQLTVVLGELKEEKEIAIDLEHHSYRSYQGFTCLMQISTNRKDYIIDTLMLRDDLQILNEIFTDSNILKIFHGADLDIEWLQRDLGLYVVNMFDTHQAAKILGLAGLSLKFLLQHYCNVRADKQFQLADWRIRPLPTELIYYARQDTHYLIYIARILHNELLEKANGTNMLKAVYMNSRNICLKTYFKPKTSDDSFMDMYKRSKRTFDNRQLYALREIFMWRDNIARLEDESCGYVLPNHMLLQIAENLPREMQGILACCNPIPSLLRQNLNSLHKIILKARDQPIVKKHINQENTERMLLPTKDFSNKINSLYDSSFEAELLTNDLHLIASSFSSDFGFNFKSVLNIFEDIQTGMRDKNNSKLHKSQNMKFASPYQRYKAVISINEQESQTIINCVSNKDFLLCPVKVEETDRLTENQKKQSTNDVNKTHKRKANDDLKDISEIGKVSFNPRNHSSSSQAKNVAVKFPIDVALNNSPKVTNIIEETNIKIKNEDSVTNKKLKYFDYSTIDIRKFQGGSHKHPKIDQTKGNSKKKRTDFKKYNKFFTFNSGNKK